MVGDGDGFAAGGECRLGEQRAAEGARLTMPPHPVWYAGRKAILIASEKGFEPEFGRLRTLAAAANRQPAAAHYVPPGASEYRPLALDVLRIDGGRIEEI